MENSLPSLLLLLLLLLSRFSCVRLCATPQMEAHQAPQSLGFSRQVGFPGRASSLRPAGVAIHLSCGSGAASMWRGRLSSPVRVWGLCPGW